MTTRVLWMSRHRPTSRQIADLRRIFGNVDIILRPISVRSPSDIVELMRQTRCTEVVAVLPILDVMGLVSIGIKPLLAVAQGRHGSYKHKCFIRINEMSLNYDQLGGKEKCETA